MNLFEDILAGRIALPAMPRVTRDLLAALRHDDVSLGTLASQISLDPVLTSRVLQVANSAHYGAGRALVSVHDAVAVMGLRSLEGVLLLHGSVGTFPQVTGVDLPAFWKQSVQRGTSARLWARRWGAHEDMAQSAGLLQGMGHVILCHGLPDRAHAFFGPGTDRPQSGTERAAREQQAFGVAHPEVSAWWAAEMGLPDESVDAIEHALEQPDPDTALLTRALAAACRYTDALECGLPSPQALAEIAAELDPAGTACPDLSG